MAKYKHYKLLNKIEVWKDVIGYEGLYIVSSMGRVKSLDRIVKDRWGNDRNKEGQIISLNKKKHGYFHVNLYKNKIRKTHSVYRLVAVAFIPNTDNLPQINHKDENPSNNCVENLEWCDSEYNNNYGGHYERAYNHKGKNNPMYGKTGDKCPTSKKVYCIELNEVYNSMREAERKTGINNSCISDACKGKQKTAGKHPITGERLHWKYVED